MAKEKEGANKFTQAADKFFGQVALQLEESVDLQSIKGVERATMIAELVYKINQSIKLTREEKKLNPNSEEDSSPERAMSKVRKLNV